MYTKFNPISSHYQPFGSGLSSRAGSGSPTEQAAARAGTDKLLERLAEHIPGMGREELRGLEASEFTPDKVAGRITDFVALGLEQARRSGKSETEVQELYERAVAGVKQGFEEAQSILEDMGLLNDSLASTIDETFDLTMQGLADLDPAGASRASELISSSLQAAERYRLAESFSLSVTTREGDEVRLRFDQAASFESQLAAYQDGEGGTGALFSIERSSSARFLFSVEGDLNEEEQEAIRDLIKDISQVADDFFDGDIQSALGRAADLDLDTGALSAMQLNLSRREEYRSVAAYQQVQQGGVGNGGEIGNSGKKLGHLLQDLKGMLEQPGLGFLASPAKLAEESLAGLIPQDTRYLQASEEQQGWFDQRLSTLRDLIERLAPPAAPAPERDS